MPSQKEISDMTTDELGQLFPIIIQVYCDQWPEIFKKEKQRLTKAFAPTEIVAIDHIGSTSIPGLMAKPTIDILLQISEQMDVQKLAPAFQLLGYQLNNQPDNPPPHMTFVKGYTPKGFRGQAYHVHVRYPGDWNEIRFRDYMRNHKKAAKEYESLKLELADRFKNNREAYTEAKTDFIEKINKLTRQQNQI